jgi:hypothetical protein
MSPAAASVVPVVLPKKIPIMMRVFLGFPMVAK